MISVDERISQMRSRIRRHRTGAYTVPSEVLFRASPGTLRADALAGILLFLDQGAGRIRELAERLVALHRLEDLIEVPVALRFGRRLHLYDVHVMLDRKST